MSGNLQNLSTGITKRQERVARAAFEEDAKRQEREEEIRLDLREKIKAGLEAEAKMRDQKAAKRGSAWSDDAVLLRDFAVRIGAGEFG